jgi:hypothetical protein
LDVIWFAQYDVGTPTIGSPSRFWRPSAKKVVGVIDATVMLFFGFASWSVEEFVPLSPECFYEMVSLFVVFKLQKNLPFHRCDDIHDFLIQPLFVLGGEVFCLLFFVREKVESDCNNQNKNR